MRFILYNAMLVVIAFSTVFTAQRVRSQPTLYWTEANTGKIQRLNLKQGDVEDLISTSAVDLHNIVLDEVERKMYWTTDYVEPAPPAGIFLRANLDGSDVDTLIYSAYCAPYCPLQGVVLDPDRGKIYWSTWDGWLPFSSGGIYRSNLDGSDPVISSNAPAFGIALDPEAGMLYWGGIDQNLGVIYRSNLDGSDVETLIETASQVSDIRIALDLEEGVLYWAIRTDYGFRIRRVHLDGTGVEDLVTVMRDVSELGGLTLDPRAGKMYWAVTFHGVLDPTPVSMLQQANLDGSAVDTLVTVEGGFIRSMALDPGTSDPSTPIETYDESPGVYALSSAYPNPFNPQAASRFPLSVRNRCASI